MITVSLHFQSPIPYNPQRMAFNSASFRLGRELHEPILSAMEEKSRIGESHYHHTWSNEELTPLAPPQSKKKE